jgi:rare lipoprotein A
VTRTATATLAAALCLGGPLALPVPAAADATGGTAAPEGASGASPAGTGPAAGGGTLRTSRSALYGRRQRIDGAFAAAGAGRTVLVQRSDPRAGWVTIARALTRASGSFTAVWRADRVGRFTLRALPLGHASSSATGGPLATARMTVYAPGIATHYGPGWYGSRTACGTILTTRTVGVAHRTLPCGTLIEFQYRGRTVRAPVIDRGPYANNAIWDLTLPASRALGFSGKDWVGAIRIGRVRLAR